MLGWDRVEILTSHMVFGALMVGPAAARAGSKGFGSAQECLGRLGTIPKDKIWCRAKGSDREGAGADLVPRCPSL